MLAVLAALGFAIQDNVPPPQADIERAIKLGSEALLARAPGVVSGQFGFNYGAGYEYDPLILYTLVHSGVPLQEETVKRLLEKVLGATLQRTYQVALTAAAVAAIDPVKYQEKLVQCGQYLVDWQCDNGQWAYGDKYEPDVKAGSAGDGGAKRTVAKVKIKRSKKLGPATGDNSNAQYAALGLKACALGGCEFEDAVLTKATEWWERSQHKDGGWGYRAPKDDKEKIGSYGSPRKHTPNRSTSA